MGLSDGFRVAESGYGRWASVLLWCVWVACMAAHGAQAYSSGLSCVLLCLPVLVLMAALLRGGRVVRVPVLAWGCLLVGGGYFLTRCVLSYNVYDAWNEAAHVLAAMVFYVAGVLYVPAKDSRQWLLWAVGGAVVLQVAAMAYVGACADPHPLLRPLFSMEGTRNAVQGLFGYKNFSAAFLIASGSFALTYALVQGGRRSLGWWGVAVVALGASFFCGSRAPWLLVPAAAGLSCVLWFLSCMMRGRSAALPGAVLAVLVLAAAAGGAWFFSHEGAADRLAPLLDSHERFYLMSLAQEVGEKAPWFGNGARSFVWEALPLSWSKFAPNYAHNEYFQLFADYGLAGCVVLLAALVAHAWAGLVHVGSEDAERPALPAAALACFVVLAVYAGLDFIWHSMGLLAMSAFCAGVLAAPCKRPLKAESKVGRGVLFGLCAVVAVWLAWLAVQLFPAWCRQWEYGRLVEARAPLSERVGVLSRVVRGYHDPLVVNEYARLLPEAYPSRSSYESAVRLLDVSLEYNPRYLYNRVLKADMLDRLGRFAEAEAAHREAHPQGGISHQGVYPWRPLYVLHLAAWGMGSMKEDAGRALSLQVHALRLLERGGMVDPWSPASAMLRWSDEDSKRLRESLQTNIWFLQTMGTVPDDGWKEPMVPGGQGALYQWL